MKENDILEMKNFVINSYADLFGCSLSDATKIVEASSFIKVLTATPSFVMHYSDEYWAKEINKEMEEKLALII